MDFKMFTDQLKEIKIILPAELGIPVDLSNAGVSELLRIGEINVAYIKDVITVIIEIVEIPLIDNFKFVIFKSIPLPNKLHDNVYIIIEPISDYIAIDKSRLH